MALTGPDGEQLSHLGRRFGDPIVTTAAAPDEEKIAPRRPDRGTWVGPKPGRQAPVMDRDKLTSADPKPVATVEVTVTGVSGVDPALRRLAQQSLCRFLGSAQHLSDHDMTTLAEAITIVSTHG